MNGSNTFYAGHNATYDPNGFSRRAYQLLAARQNNSSPLRVRVNDNNSTVSAPRKRVLITGCGSGFGRNSSILLARQGYEVIATVETVHEVHSLRLEAGNEDLPMTVTKLDITDEADRLRAGSWDVDILINIAGIGEGGSMIDVPENRLRRQFEVNVFGTILLTQQVARNFVRKQSGKIIIMSSIAALNGDPFGGPYAASKHALEALADALYQEFPFGVQVATVNPGPILTGFNDRIFDSYQNWYPEDRKRAIFDYNKISYQHKQYDPRIVSECVAQVANGSVTNYRNIVPKEIQPQQRQMMAEKFSRQSPVNKTQPSLVRTAFEMKPGIPIGT